MLIKRGHTESRTIFSQHGLKFKMHFFTLLALVCFCKLSIFLKIVPILSKLCIWNSENSGLSFWKFWGLKFWKRLGTAWVKSSYRSTHSSFYQCILRLCILPFKIDHRSWTDALNNPLELYTGRSETLKTRWFHVSR